VGGWCCYMFLRRISAFRMRVAMLKKVKEVVEALRQVEGEELVSQVIEI
jgi:hypothetical protein